MCKLEFLNKKEQKIAEFHIRWIDRIVKRMNSLTEKFPGILKLLLES